MNPTEKISRRSVLRGAAALSVGLAFPTVVPAAALGRGGAKAPSERLTVGAIGLGVQGSGDVGAFAGEQIVALCDVNKEHLERAKGRFTDAAAYTDFRQVVTRDDIDVVMVATPDHWHAIISVWAMRHGKDVFCEKPLSLTVKEGRAMVGTARRYGRVFSCGSQRVRGDHGQLADYVASGAIGRIKEIFVGCGGPSGPCNLPGEPVPEWLDWDMWLGPAPAQPFHPGRIATFNATVNGAQWRNYFDFSGGMMTDWGAHHFGGAMYGAQIDHMGPTDIIPPDADHKYLTMHFANGMIMHHGSPRGSIYYVGTDGSAPDGRPLHSAARSPLRQYSAPGLYADFLDCVRTRKRCFQDVEYAHRVASVCHLCNIVYRLKRPLKFDPDKEVFIGDAEANRMLDRARREPWNI